MKDYFEDQRRIKSIVGERIFDIILHSFVIEAETDWFISDMSMVWFHD